LVIAEQQAISKRLMEERLGESVRVLAEGFSKDNPEELVGRTERDERVVFPAGPEKIGCFVEVFLTELTGATLRGKIV
jgi:tRNA-2-methylthio-N6-dimethylallyladenosine synthase